MDPIRKQRKQLQEERLTEFAPPSVYTHKPTNRPSPVIPPSIHPPPPPILFPPSSIPPPPPPIPPQHDHTLPPPMMVPQYYNFVYPHSTHPPSN